MIAEAQPIQTMIKIGIDPAFRKSGIGFCMQEGKEVIFKKYSIIELLNDINAGCFKNASVCVENSDMQSFKFKLKKMTSFYRNKGYQAERIHNLCAEYGARVGKNQAVSQIICNAIKFKCASLYEVSPKGKGSKDLDDSSVFSTCEGEGWSMNKKRLNQDNRDAFKLMLLAK